MIDRHDKAHSGLRSLLKVQLPPPHTHTHTQTGSSFKTSRFRLRFLVSCAEKAQAPAAALHGGFGVLSGGQVEGSLRGPSAVSLGRPGELAGVPAHGRGRVLAVSRVGWGGVIGVIGAVAARPPTTAPAALSTHPQIQERLGQLETAKDTCHHILKHQPTFPGVHRVLGRLHLGVAQRVAEILMVEEEKEVD